VVPLRDAEERSAVAPAWGDYGPLYRAHRWLSPLGAGALAVGVAGLARGLLGAAARVAPPWP
jgi:hypothetical protein